MSDSVVAGVCLHDAWAPPEQLSSQASEAPTTIAGSGTAHEKMTDLGVGNVAHVLLRIP